MDEVKFDKAITRGRELVDELRSLAPYLHITKDEAKSDTARDTNRKYLRGRMRFITENMLTLPWEWDMLDKREAELSGVKLDGGPNLDTGNPLSGKV